MYTSTYNELISLSVVHQDLFLLSLPFFSLCTIIDDHTFGGRLVNDEEKENKKE